MGSFGKNRKRSSADHLIAVCLDNNQTLFCFSINSRALRTARSCERNSTQNPQFGYPVRMKSNCGAVEPNEYNSLISLGFSRLLLFRTAFFGLNPCVFFWAESTST